MPLFTKSITIITRFIFTNSNTISMSQVRENQISKQNKRVEMIIAWQSDVSCDRNLTSQSHVGSNDPLSTTPILTKLKKCSKLSNKSKLFPNLVITFMCKLSNNCLKMENFENVW